MRSTANLNLNSVDRHKSHFYDAQWGPKPNFRNQLFILTINFALHGYFCKNIPIFLQEDGLGFVKSAPTR